MPPMPPPPACGMAGPCRRAASLTAASVVISRPATEAASCSAVRTTLVGSITPAVDEVLVVVGLGVEAERLVIAVEQLARDHRAVMRRHSAAIWRSGDCKRLADDVDAAGLVVVGALQALERLGGIEQSRAAAGDDAFLDRGAGRVERVVDAVLALLDLDLGSSRRP